MSDSFTPLGDRVLLRRVDSGSVSKAGFAIPDAAKEKPTECEVVAVSSGYTTEWGQFLICPVNVGDRVLIGKYSGANEVKLDGVEHIAIRWSELIGIVKRESVN